MDYKNLTTVTKNRGQRSSSLDSNVKKKNSFLSEERRKSKTLSPKKIIVRSRGINININNLATEKESLSPKCSYKGFFSLHPVKAEENNPFELQDKGKMKRFGQKDFTSTKKTLPMRNSYLVQDFTHIKQRKLKNLHTERKKRGNNARSSSPALIERRQFFVKQENCLQKSQCEDKGSSNLLNNLERVNTLLQDLKTESHGNKSKLTPFQKASLHCSVQDSVRSSTLKFEEMEYKWKKMKNQIGTSSQSKMLKVPLELVSGKSEGEFEKKNCKFPKLHKSDLNLLPFESSLRFSSHSNSNSSLFSKSHSKLHLHTQITSTLEGPSGRPSYLSTPFSYCSPSPGETTSVHHQLPHNANQNIRNEKCFKKLFTSLTPQPTLHTPFQFQRSSHENSQSSSNLPLTHTASEHAPKNTLTNIITPDDEEKEKKEKAKKVKKINPRKINYNLDYREIETSTSLSSNPKPKVTFESYSNPTTNVLKEKHPLKPLVSPSQPYHPISKNILHFSFILYLVNTQIYPKKTKDENTANCLKIVDPGMGKAKNERKSEMNEDHNERERVISGGLINESMESVGMSLKSKLKSLICEELEKAKGISPQTAQIFSIECLQNELAQLIKEIEHDDHFKSFQSDLSFSRDSVYSTDNTKPPVLCPRINPPKISVHESDEVVISSEGDSIKMGNENEIDEIMQLTDEGQTLPIKESIVFIEDKDKISHEVNNNPKASFADQITLVGSKKLLKESFDLNRSVDGRFRITENFEVEKNSRRSSIKKVESPPKLGSTKSKFGRLFIKLI
jgi:hypothetical protein